jgi:hypothetical protein
MPSSPHISIPPLVPSPVPLLISHITPFRCRTSQRRYTWALTRALSVCVVDRLEQCARQLSEALFLDWTSCWSITRLLGSIPEFSVYIAGIAALTERNISVPCLALTQ